MTTTPILTPSIPDASTNTPRSRRILANLTVYLAGIFVAACVFLAVAGAVITPQDPDAQDLLLGATPPSSEHVLGTDDLGRDVFSRLLSGARTAVMGPAVIAAGALILGSAVGLLAGFRGGALGAALMRTCELIYAVPGLLVAIVIAGVSGGGYWVAVALFVIMFFPADARLVRAATLVQRQQPYVEAARLLGTRTPRMLLTELWPNVRSVEFANAFLTFAYGLVALSALSFLGIGVGAGVADWGGMLADARSYMDQNPYAALAPGLAIALLAGGVTILGDAFEERVRDSGKER